jgi:predicted nucleic acid-binding protein
VILADTSVWIDHLRSTNLEMRNLLGRGQIAIHPLVVAELALGSVRDRARTLLYLDLLPATRVAQIGEVRHMIEAHILYSKGIGLTDAHLIASVLITPGTHLWTLDKRLRAIAKSLGIHAILN